MQLRVSCSALRNVTGSKMNTAAEAGHSRMGQPRLRRETLALLAGTASPETLASLAGTLRVCW